MRYVLTMTGCEPKAYHQKGEAKRDAKRFMRQSATEISAIVEDTKDNVTVFEAGGCGSLITVHTDDSL